ncbi:MAG: hypothetical protein Q9191_005155 [Dirinaria sp. TL-2023a]
MGGTIIITGANGSLAIPAVQHLLTHYPDYTPLLTVRNASEADVNTNKLRSILARFPDIKSAIVELDLASLSAVQDFSSSIAADIAAGKLPPIAAIVCNAYYWNLVQDVQITENGYEKTFQVSHLAHVSLVLRLLSSFVTAGGRVNSLEKYPPTLPEDLDLLVKPDVRKTPDDFGWKFQRYANSKLAIVTWIQITAVAINPGNLSNSRTLQTNTPTMLYYLSKFIIRPLRPLLRLMDPTMRTAAEAASDVIDLATDKAYPRQRGYFTLLKKDEGAPESRDQEKQRKIWAKSAQWARITPENTALKAALE